MKKTFSSFLIAISFLYVSNSLAYFEIPKADILKENEFLISKGFKIDVPEFIRPDAFNLSKIQSRMFISPSSWYKAPKPDTLSANALLNDLDYLKFALEKQYINYDRFEKRGLNWNGLFADWKSFLISKHDAIVDPAEAFSPLLQIRRQFLDNHFGPAIKADLYSLRSTTAVLAANPVADCTHFLSADGQLTEILKSPSAQPYRIRRPIKNFGKSVDASYVYAISWPQINGTYTQILCGNSFIDLNLAWSPNKQERLKNTLELSSIATDQPNYRRVDSEVAVLRFPSMFGVQIKPYRELAAKMTSLSDGTEKILIVDMRGNGGGSANLAEAILYRWISQPIFEKVVKTLFSKVTERTSCLTESFEWALNGVIFSDWDNAADLKNSQSLLNATFRIPEPSCPTGQRLVEEYSNTSGEFDFSTRPGFNPHAKDLEMPLILVVYDNECGSDCEMLITRLSAFRKVLFAGKNSAGVGGGGAHPGIFVLPNTRVVFWASMWDFSNFKDSREITGYGLTPDVLLDSAESYSAANIIALGRSLLN